jgi:hypothetical protein
MGLSKKAFASEILTFIYSLDQYTLVNKEENIKLVMVEMNPIVKKIEEMRDRIPLSMEDK